MDWPSLAKLRGTLVVLMGVENSGAIAAKLVEHGRAADTPAAVIQEGTTAAQRRVDATLATLGETVRAEGVRPPAVIVIGEVVAVAATAPQVPTGNRSRTRSLEPRDRTRQNPSSWQKSAPSTTPRPPAGRLHSV